MEFEFARPWWLLGLPLVFIGPWYLRRSLASAQRWLQSCDPDLLERLIRRFRSESASGTAQAKAWTRLGDPGGLAPWVLALGLAIALVALAGPSVPQDHQGLFRSNAARVIVLDLSRSMNATDLGASRLDLARLKVIDLLRRTVDGQTAVVVFAGDAFLLAPMTDDSNTLEGLLRALSTDVMPVQGSALSSGLTLARELIEDANVPTAEVIVVADGVDPQAAKAAARLREAGVKVSVLAVGTRDGAPIPQGERGFVSDANGALVISRLAESGLRAVSTAGGGHYRRIAPTDADLDALLAGPVERSTGALASARQSRLVKDLGCWLVLLLLPLGALGFRRGWLLLWPLAIGLPATSTVEALDWATLWKRPDQISADAFRAGDYSRAEAYANTPWQRGAAAFRAGRFRDASNAFAENASATGHYNRGNALARAGDLRGALEAYQITLDRYPAHRDARFNRAVVMRLLRSRGGGQGQSSPSSGPADETTSNRGQRAPNDLRREEESQSSGSGGREANPSPPDDGAYDNPDSGREAGMNQSTDRAGGDSRSDTAPRHRREGRAQGEGQLEAQSPHGGLDQVSDQDRAQQTARHRALRQFLREVPDDPRRLAAATISAAVPASRGHRADWPAGLVGAR